MEKEIIINMELNDKINDSLKTIYYLTFLQRNELDQFKSDIDSIDKELTKNEIILLIDLASQNYEYNRVNGSRKYYLNENNQQKINFFTSKQI